MYTDHGVIETPIFMPVGTQAAVKTLDSKDLNDINAQIILGNTYHLHLRPGEDLIANEGGLHKFMNWNKPILTDSGGFQVFSLGLQKEAQESKDQGKLVSIDDEGVTFSSHLDGSKHRFTPEASIEIQHKLGADIIMAFDECTPDDADSVYAKKALERTHRWAKQSLDAHASNITYHGYRQFLFGIIQGAQHKELRQESARLISSLNFDGIAVGGESIGYNMEATAEILDWVYPLIPENKPHYAMGVGLNPTDLLVAVEHGVDMFDCVAPTRLARHGMLYVKDVSKKHRLNIKNSSCKTDKKPIDEQCSCSTCQNYSRSYIHHLFAAGEMTGMRLASIHNLHFLLQMMQETRKAILEDRFNKFRKEWE
jgi:queuine tRNA-ribosyltransferase